VTSARKYQGRANDREFIRRRADERLKEGEKLNQMTSDQEEKGEE
jgi:hypothetical protein